MRWEFAGQYGLRGCVYHSFDGITFLEELYPIDDGFGDGNLLEGLGVHEVQPHIILVEVLVGTTFDAYFFDLDAAVPRLVDDATRGDVLELRANESWALTRLDVKEFDDEVVLPIDVEAHTITEVCCSSHIIID